jgi:serine-type D-Ala-D-Ala carboxypeptidase/endopeptidase (penicillin-binding protein 4)
VTWVYAEVIGTNSQMIASLPACVPLVLGLLLVALDTACGQVSASEPPLQELARTHFDSNQGLLVQAEDGTILAALNAGRGFHPASVTKVASTLALLHELGPNHRIRTEMSARGRVGENALAGDILIRSQGDPYFVFENAFLMLLELNALGIRHVHGNVRVQGPFLFNWNPDPRGKRLEQALAGQVGAERWRAVKLRKQDKANVGLADIALRFGRNSGNSERGDEIRVVHDSAPLRRLLKEFNGYSNNIFHIFSQQIGGPRNVERITREAVPQRLRSRVVIDNAAGGGRTNRLSPSAAVAIFRALDRKLAAHGLSLSDVLPVAGIDSGTLENRFDSSPHRGAVVGKTGTLPSVAVSALAGVAYTKRYGRVFFAILNKGLPIGKARKTQDAFVRSLLEHAQPLPPTYRQAAGPAFTEARVQRSR